MDVKSMMVIALLGLATTSREQSSSLGVTLADMPEDTLYGSIVVENLDQQLLSTIRQSSLQTIEWHQFFRVFYNGLEPGVSAGNLPAMMGKYGLAGDRLFFRPRLPFIEGRYYRVWFDPGRQKEAWKKISSLPVDTVIGIPEVTALPAPEVLAVYPSADEWPANQLKFYLLFSMPMRPGEAYDHLRLIDANGQPVDEPFLPLEPELWDASGCRLTVWFDPGRIKRELIPNRELGTPLQAGQTYRLVIDGEWRDTNGRPLGNDYQKKFFTLPPDRRQPQPEEWSLKAPAAGSRQPLVLAFPEPLDFAVLGSSIAIFNAEGDWVEGTIEVIEREKGWRFLPDHPWEPGDYELRIRSDLEDLAGNNLERLFDREIDLHRIEKTWPSGPATLPFTILPKE